MALGAAAAHMNRENDQYEDEPRSRRKRRRGFVELGEATDGPHWKGVPNSTVSEADDEEDDKLAFQTPKKIHNNGRSGESNDSLSHHTNCNDGRSGEKSRDGKDDDNGRLSLQHSREKHVGGGDIDGGAPGEMSGLGNDHPSPNVSSYQISSSGVVEPWSLGVVESWCKGAVGNRVAEYWSEEWWSRGELGG